jgi:tRNA(His) guanylyltransferase
MVEESKDSMGDRMKAYEREFTGLELPKYSPSFARLDGRSFSTFTRKIQCLRPYDSKLHAAMKGLTEHLMHEASADVGYTQSDEITLFWYRTDVNTQIYFNGKTFKMISGLASSASVFFNKTIDTYMLAGEMLKIPYKEGGPWSPTEYHEVAQPPRPSSLSPTFDCRVWTVPSLSEAGNVFLWRHQDAVRNSVQASGQSMFSHAQLENKAVIDIKQMLLESGVVWADFPEWARRGSFVVRRKLMTKFTAEEMDKLPPKHAARTNPGLEVERGRFVWLANLPDFSSGDSVIDFLMKGT